MTICQTQKLRMYKCPAGYALCFKSSEKNGACETTIKIFFVVVPGHRETFLA